MATLIIKQHLTTQRLGEASESNADCVSVRQGGLAVIADGASVSYDARRWAQLVVDHLDVGPPLPHLLRIASQFSAQTPEDLPWNLEVLAERGAHATYLAVKATRFMNVDALWAEAVGDCLLVVHQPGPRSLTRCWPFSHSDEFPHAPSAVSSVIPHIRGHRHPSVGIHVTPRSRIFLMTDALGRYVCRHLESGHPFEEVPFTNSGFDADDFTQWSIDVRGEELLEDDDLTFVEVGSP